MITKQEQELLLKLGDFIKKTRLSQNITQDQLAFEANITRNQIGRIERGEINTTVLSLNRIATVLNITLPQLLDLD